MTPAKARPESAEGPGGGPADKLTGLPTGNRAAVRKRFGPAEFPVIDQARARARELVATRYRLDFDDFAAWPVDIKLYAELRPQEKKRGVLAQLLRYERSGPESAGRRPDYYRICLYDPLILAVLEREPDLRLPSLLLYIFTHEFVHVARFARFMELFSQDDERREAEEAIVNRECAEILRNVKVEGLERVMARYDDICNALTTGKAGGEDA